LLIPKKGFKRDLDLKYVKKKYLGVGSGHLWEQFILPLYSSKELLLCLGNTAPLISLFLNRKTIVTVHDLSFKYFPDAYSLNPLK
jgi:hypothetical protein